MKKINIVISLLLFLLMPLMLSGTYENTYDFLNIPESGITELVSGSGHSTIEGIGSVYGNPAGFSGNRDRNVLFSDTEGLGDTRKMGLFYGQSLKPFNIIAGLRYFYLKDEIKTDTKNIGYKSYSMDVSLSRKFAQLRDLETGLHISYAGSRLGTYNASLLLFDAGFQYKLTVPYIGSMSLKKNLGLGLSVNRIGFSLKSYGEEEQVPLIVSGGFKYQYLQLPFLLSRVLVNYLYDTAAAGTISIGMGFTLFSLVELSLGYRTGDTLNPLSMGLGIRYLLNHTEYRLDYTIMPAGDFSPVHLISLIVSI
ncbi:MAG: hypothetical protein PHF84_05915 [bacterium]|nr:hypothetical protein [bacterium]